MGFPQLRNRNACREDNKIVAEKSNERHNDKPCGSAAREKIRGYPCSAYVTNTSQRGKHICTKSGTFIHGDFPVDLTGEELESIRNELIYGGNTQADKNGRGLIAAFVTGHQNLGAGLSLRVNQNAVLLDDQRRTQRHHKYNTENTAAQGD